MCANGIILCRDVIKGCPCFAIDDRLRSHDISLEMQKLGENLLQPLLLAVCIWHYYLLFHNCSKLYQ